MKFQLELTLEDNDDVKVKVANPGDISPYFIIGLLEKVKVECLLGTQQNEVT